MVVAPSAVPQRLRSMVPASAYFSSCLPGLFLLRFPFTSLSAPPLPSRPSRPTRRPHATGPHSVHRAARVDGSHGRLTLLTDSGTAWLPSSGDADVALRLSHGLFVDGQPVSEFLHFDPYHAATSCAVECSAAAAEGIVLFQGHFLLAIARGGGVRPSHLRVADARVARMP